MPSLDSQGGGGGGGGSLPTAGTLTASQLLNPFLGAGTEGTPTSFPGEISKVWPGGFFDIHYEMGGKEVKVPRSRIRLACKDEWRQVYSGLDLDYACEANVPDVVLERERGVQIDLEFCLQTLGTEYPIEEGSIFSEVGEYSTVNHDLMLEKFMNTMDDGGGGGGSSVGGDSKTKRKIKEAIKIDGHVIEVWQQGKMVEGTGYGQHFV